MDVIAAGARLQWRGPLSATLVISTVDRRGLRA